MISTQKSGSKTSLQETAICLFLPIKMKSDNPYEAYVVNHAKGTDYSHLGGSLPGFQGARMQRGFGLGSLFRGFYCTALPFAKPGAKLLGTTLPDTGANVTKDVSKDKIFGNQLKNRESKVDYSF